MAVKTGHRRKRAPLKLPEQLDELIDGLREESPLRYERGLDLALNAIRVLVLEQARLEQAIINGTIVADEAKQVNGNASNLRRWFEAIGMTGAPKRAELKDPDDDGAPL